MKIGLLWHTLRHPNLGIDALTRANLSIIDRAAKRAGVRPDYILFGHTFTNERDPEFSHVEIGGCPGLKAVITGGAVASRMRACDIVFDIGEGDSFADIYGTRRFIQQLASKIVLLTKRTPLVLAPQTIGPFNGRWTRMAAALVMRRCLRVFARDHLSSQELRRLKVNSNVAEFVDVAFCLPFYRPAPEPKARTRVGINVSALLYNGGYTGANAFGLSLDYAALTKRLIKAFLARGDVEVILIAHVMTLDSSETQPGAGAAEAAFVEDDHAVCRRLAEAYPDVTVAPKFATSTKAKSFISGLDFLIAGRMHACIAAVSSGVPTAPIAYSRKFSGLFGGIGYHRSVDARKETTDTAYNIVLDLFERRKDLEDEANASRKKAIDLLDKYEDALVSLFVELAPGQP